MSELGSSLNLKGVGVNEWPGDSGSDIPADSFDG